MASRRSVARRGGMAQGKSPRNPLAFASVFYPGRCLASQPTGSGGGFAVVLRNRPLAGSRKTVLLPPPLLVSVLLCSRLRCPVSGVYPATWTAHAAPVLIHLFHCTAIIFAAVSARHRHCRCLCHRRHTFGQTKRGGLCCRPAVPNAPLVGIFKCLLNCGCRSML